MKSLLYTDESPFQTPTLCSPGRTEQIRTLRKGGRLYRVAVRDKAVVEDSYVDMVKAVAFSIQTQEQYNYPIPSRRYRDYLIKRNIEI